MISDIVISGSLEYVVIYAYVNAKLIYNNTLKLLNQKETDLKNVNICCQELESSLKRHNVQKINITVKGNGAYTQEIIEYLKATSLEVQEKLYKQMHDAIQKLILQKNN